MENKRMKKVTRRKLKINKKWKLAESGNKPENARSAFGLLIDNETQIEKHGKALY